MCTDITKQKVENLNLKKVTFLTTLENTINSYVKGVGNNIYFLIMNKIYTLLIRLLLFHYLSS